MARRSPCIPRPRHTALAGLFVLLTLGGCSSGWGSWNNGSSVSYGVRADTVSGLRSETAVHTVAPLPGEIVRVRNLAGTVRLMQADVAEVELRATVHARGASDEQTEALLASMQWVQSTDEDGHPEWTLDYPVERHGTFHYVTDDRGFRLESRRPGRRTIKITTEKRPGTPTLFADVEITYPHHAAAACRSLVGTVTGDTLTGDLTVETTMGDVRLGAFDGDLAIDTGSGDVTVGTATGSALIDTGSGNIEIGTLAADAVFDTGSGDIHVATADSPRIVADTGSGNVVIDGGAVGRLLADTGSGDVEVHVFDLRSFNGDTGSGDILLRSPLVDTERVYADTGSGDVTIIAGHDASFDLRAGVGSGRVRVEFDDATLHRHRGAEIIGARRADGRTEIVVDTGSGDCTLRRSDES